MDLTDRSQHFEFGQNWADYALLVDEPRRQAAEENVRELAGDVAGKTFLDIGSGSGLFSLAALRLGAARVMAVDLDENSVATTRKVLATADAADRWQAEQISVFDLSPDRHGTFDIVYSWGVLHHTGKMWDAIDKASAMVRPGGTFAFALYEKTPLCGFWKKEKRFYMKRGPRTQKFLQRVYMAAYGGALLASGRNPWKRLSDKKKERGMDPMHDVHDWMGGYPYESTTPAEVAAFLKPKGFTPVLEKPVPVRAMGLGGSGCSEYVYTRAA